YDRFDTTTSTGKAMFGTSLTAFGEFERDIIQQMSKAYLDAARVSVKTWGPYWIAIRENGKRVLEIRIHDNLVISIFDYKGDKKYSNNFLLEDDSILNLIESLFEK